VTALLTLVHVVVCVILIAAVLLQSGKAADLAGAFGGAGSSTSFGPRGTASLLAKVTTGCAVLFMVTSLGLWMVGSKASSTVLKETKTAAETTPAPAAEQKQPAAAKAQPAASSQPQPQAPVKK
jgi:preprotein translocase subunit SecG